jgi:NTP pyrophosphatase (non-canonical NTP hydrolase)
MSDHKNDLDSIDRLSEMFIIQFENQIKFKIFSGNGCLPRLEITEMEKLFEKNVLYLIKEATEVLDEINFKSHLKNRKEINREAIKEELIDVLKYWMNLCLLFNFTSDDIYIAFKDKSDKVMKRLAKEFKSCQ